MNMLMDSDLVEIWTDGGCKPNPGRGGWAVVLRYKGAEREMSGGEAATTNNRMELTAAAMALESLKRPCNVVLHTDSQYLKDGITRWHTGWVRKNWRTAGGDPVFNTRTLDATVELRDGQSFSVAGLLQNDTSLSQNQLPWIGDVPILGSLFKSSSYQKHDTELVVIVTPRLVQPSTPGQVVASPLDQTQPANDAEFFALGQMEVTPKMIQQFQSGAGVSGPYGFIINLGQGTGS